MRSENILSADILDLIFENRNKNYGAYVLRKQYKGHLAKALGLVFLAAAALLLITRMYRPEPKSAAFIHDVYKVQILPLIELEAQKKPSRPVTPPPPATKGATEQRVSAVVMNETDHDKLSDNLDSASIGSNKPAGPDSGPQEGKDPGPQESGGGDGAAPAKTIDKQTPRMVADLMPVYPGGMDALRKFLLRNLQNPEDMEPGTVISVKIRFLVGYDGKLKSFQTVEDGGHIFNNEVVRVLKKMPVWIPGKTNGEEVSVYYTIPVKFTAAE